ncbi:major facilitator superfamily transporter [Nocardia nova SH22a]|uniref:Major facilitator superfamily transporter n=1 Tax=Nocardia nova SH22a TaxID=1415166 RepID=W5THX3_9NOCA|nr:MFS transporter [Nocardia nova]AHH18930.1 major facilitator superfamily transporter [Nocardia nova SH22a]
MATATTSVESPDEDTGRLENASKLRVTLIILAIVASTEIVPFHFTFIGLTARYIGQSFPEQSAGQLTWLTTLYSLVGGVAVPVFGKLSDLVGKKKVILFCLVLSIIGCAIDAMTSSWTLMLVGRGLQGLAFPAIFVSYGLIRDLAPRRYLNMAIALAGGGTGVGAILGPVIGGVLTDHYSWRSLFWFCVIWTVVTILPLALFVPETKLRAKVKIDLLGALLLGTGIAGVLIYLSNGSTWGWGQLSALSWLIGGVILLVLFYAWELFTPEPIMDPKLLRAPRFGGILVAAFLSVGIMQGLSYAMGYLAETPGGAAGDAVKKQIVDGAAAQAAQQASEQMHMQIPPSMVTQYFSVGGTLPGFNLTLLQFTMQTMLGLAVVYVLVAPLCGWMSTRIGLLKPYLASTVAFLVGCLLFAWFHDHVWQMALIALVIGIGAGAYLGTLPNMVVEAVPQEQQGISAGMYGAFNSFGTAAATAAVAAIMSANPLILHINAPGHVEDRKLNTGPMAQLPDGAAYTDIFYLFAGAAAVALVLALVLLRFYNRPSTGATAH